MTSSSSQTNEQLLFNTDFKFGESKKNNLSEPALLNQKGEELFRRGDLPGALNLFTKAAQINPNFSLTHNNLGVVYWQTQRWKEAVIHHLRALEISPNCYNIVSNCYQAYNTLATLTREREDQNSEYPFLLAQLAGGIMKFQLLGIDPSEQIKFLNNFKSILVSLELKFKNQTVNDLNPSEQYFLSAYRYCICNIYLQNNIVNGEGGSLLNDIHSNLVRMDLWQLGCLDQYDNELFKKIIQTTNHVKGALHKYKQYFGYFALMLFEKPSEIAFTINSDAVYLKYLNYLKHKNPQQNNTVYSSRVLANLGLPVEKALWYVENYADISKFKDKHSGGSCFIIGNGPSLRKMDLSPLRHRITFGMNKIHLLFDKLGFETTYLAAANPYVIQQAAKEISNLTMPRFIMMWGREYIQKNENIIFLRENRHRLFVKDMTKGVCIDATVTYMAMQIAFYMGFKTVILIGVDHFFESKGQPHTTVQLSGEDPNHFDPNYFGYGVPWQLPDLAGSERAYQRAKNIYKNDGRCILDATVDGKLQVFPKISYDEALRLTG